MATKEAELVSILDKRIGLLRKQADNLKGLLDDPQPGLFMWLVSVARVRKEIDAIMDGERD